jgi:hypothetical protein
MIRFKICYLANCEYKYDIPHLHPYWIKTVHLEQSGLLKL